MCLLVHVISEKRNRLTCWFFAFLFCWTMGVRLKYRNSKTNILPFSLLQSCKYDDFCSLFNVWKKQRCDTSRVLGFLLSLPPHPLDFPHFHQHFKIIYVLATLFSVFSSRRRWPCGQSVRLVSGGRRFESRPRQTKIFKLVVVISPLKLRIMGTALRLFRQCQANGLIKFWLKLVFWICELSPLHN